LIAAQIVVKDYRQAALAGAGKLQLLNPRERTLSGRHSAACFQETIMQAIRFNRKLQIWSAAMAALAVSAVAPSVWADTAYSTNAFTGGQIGTNSANSFNANSFVDIYGSGTTKQAFGVFDFNTSNLGIAAGNQVSSVTDIKFDLYNSSFAAAAKTPINVNFYLATDTTTTPLFASTGLTGLA
jgi:hypothetical protein